MNKNTATIIITVLIIETLTLGWLVYERFAQQNENENLQTY